MNTDLYLQGGAFVYFMVDDQLTTEAGQVLETESGESFNTEMFLFPF